MASDALIERNNFTNENFYCLSCRSPIQFNLSADWFTQCTETGDYKVQWMKLISRRKKSVDFPTKTLRPFCCIQHIGHLIVIFLFHWDTNNANSTSLWAHRKWNMKIRCTRIDSWSTFADEQQEKTGEKNGKK